MNTLEARALLAKELDSWRQQPYAALASFVDGEPVLSQVLGEEKYRYQLEIQVVWDSRPGGDVRVLGAIDDGGFRAFVPLADSFIMTPDGRFVGEDPV